MSSETDAPDQDSGNNNEDNIPRVVLDVRDSDDNMNMNNSEYETDSDEEVNLSEDYRPQGSFIRMAPYVGNANQHPFPGTYVTRDENPELPETVSVLTTFDGCKVYIVGTAHFSESSQEDVIKTISVTKPDTVVVELCSSRINILRMDEQTLMEEAKNINFAKIQHAINQSGVVQGILHLLFLTMSAHITKQLGMAPGGEFRAALREASKLDGCRVRLGDRPIQVTLRRALSSLSMWQKLKLAWHLLTSNDPISKEEVEKCKQKDLLEEMLREMTGEYPGLSQVFVKERDLFLAEFIHNTAAMLPNPKEESGLMPSVTVAVVGMGHVQGIKDHWGSDIDIRELMIIPPTSLSERLLKLTIRATVVGVLAWGCYKAGSKIAHYVS